VNTLGSHSHSEHEKLRITKISLLVTLVLIVIKTTAGLLSGSLALISLATDSAFDFLSVLFTFVAVRVSALPPDEDHPYGHGKFDSISGLFQSIFLVGVSVWIFIEAVIRLRSPESVALDIDGFTFIILGVSFFLDMWRARAIKKTADASRSQVLGADALHFLADGLSVVIVAIGIILAEFFHIPAADSYAAIAVSLFVGFQSIKQGKSSVDVLMDRMPMNGDSDAVMLIIKDTDGILEVDSLRMREASSVLFIDAFVQINRVLPFVGIQHILANLENRIREKYPTSEINIQWKPVKTENESPFETIKIITSDYGILPHNIELTRDEKGELTLDLHIEFPSGSDFNDAHAKSEEIEAAIKLQMPEMAHIITHLEEERSDMTIQEMRDVTEARATIIDALKEYVGSNSELVEIKSYRLLQSVDSGELKLTVTMNVVGSQLLGDAHDAVTRIEANLKKRFPELHRVVIHTEPSTIT
jgi:cation diffusion facilitator family transporter